MDYLVGSEAGSIVLMTSKGYEEIEPSSTHTNSFAAHCLAETVQVNAELTWKKIFQSIMCDCARRIYSRFVWHV